MKMRDVLLHSPQIPILTIVVSTLTCLKFGLAWFPVRTCYPNYLPPFLIQVFLVESWLGEGGGRWAQQVMLYYLLISSLSFNILTTVLLFKDPLTLHCTPVVVVVIVVVAYIYTLCGCEWVLVPFLYRMRAIQSNCDPIERDTQSVIEVEGPLSTS